MIRENMRGICEGGIYWCNLKVTEELSLLYVNEKLSEEYVLATVLLPERYPAGYEVRKLHYKEILDSSPFPGSYRAFIGKEDKEWKSLWPMPASNPFMREF